MTLTLRGYDDAPDLREYPIERLDLKFWSGLAEIQQVSEDTIHDVFGFYLPVAEALPEGFHAGAPWPVITLPAGKDAAVLVVFRDGEYDAGIDYLVRETPDAEALLIGSCDTASPATGLMWTELSRVAAYGANETERAARILLLAPICVDGVHGSKLAAAVKEALAVYRVPGDTEYLAELLVGRPEDWAAYPAWEESEGIRSFPGRGSRRNRHSGLLTEEQHRSVARILS